MKFMAKNSAGVIKYMNHRRESFKALADTARTKRDQQFNIGAMMALDELTGMIQKGELQLEVEIAATRAREFLISVRENDYRSVDNVELSSIINQLNECLTITHWEQYLEWKKEQQLKERPAK